MGYSPLRDIFWLVASNMNFIFHFIYGMSSFPLTNSYFSRCLKPPTSFVWSILGRLSLFQAAARTRLAVQFTAPGIAETVREAMPLPAAGEVLVVTTMSGKLGTSLFFFGLMGSWTEDTEEIGGKQARHYCRHSCDFSCFFV